MARRTQDGFVLVSVLGIMALLAALVGAASLLVRSAVDGARTSTDDLTLSALVRAGVELAAYQIYVLKLPTESINAQQVRFDAGIVTLFVADESSKIDLNGASSEFLAAAYQGSGLSTLSGRSFAARVVDWRDENDQPSPGGAEAADYASAGLDYRPQNDAFRSVDDLQWLLGLTMPQANALARKFTVYNPDGKVNVLGATRDVLISLPEITAPTVDQILTIRSRQANTAAQDILALLQKQKEFVKVDAGPSFRIRIEARAGDVNFRSADVVITSSPNSESLYYILEWAE
jgi:general secretion pathway protein K